MKKKNGGERSRVTSLTSAVYQPGCSHRTLPPQDAGEPWKAQWMPSGIHMALHRAKQMFILQVLMTWHFVDPAAVLSGTPENGQF